MSKSKIEARVQNSFWACVVFISIFSACSVVLADNIVLKSGNEVKGKVLEKNKDYVKVEVCGVTVTYFTDEIKSINKHALPAETAPKAVITNKVSTTETAAPAVLTTGPEMSWSSNAVFLKNRQLFVRKNSPGAGAGQPKPYIIKGISWNPATIAPDAGPNPLEPYNPSANVPYGFFFDWEGRVPQGHDVFVYWLRRQFVDRYLEDIPLIRKMNVNTVRVYNDFGLDPGVYRRILDEFIKNDIMVIMTVASSRSEITGRRYLEVVSQYKDHPAILMWSLGNEWNMDYNKYWGYTSVEEAARATNEMAREVKKIDAGHPVCSVLGDRFADPDPSNTIASVLKVCPDVDVWGITVYRGESMGGLFSQWRDISSKPLFIAEFGTDSFRTASYEVTSDNRAYNCQGQEDEEMQAVFMRSLWKEIKTRLSALDEKEFCLGGLVHEFNDELWKIGSYHALLGGLVNYDDPQQKRAYMRYDEHGFYIKGGHPDDVSNEEHFGVVRANRNPKKVFYEIEQLYKE